ncbi:MAG: hypothetical protein ABIH29_02640 [Candidatus Micrarchaeota archaeon]
MKQLTPNTNSRLDESTAKTRECKRPVIAFRGFTGDSKRLIMGSARGDLFEDAKNGEDRPNAPSELAEQVKASAKMRANAVAAEIERQNPGIKEMDPAAVEEMKESLRKTAVLEIMVGLCCTMKSEEGNPPALMEPIEGEKPLALLAIDILRAFTVGNELEGLSDSTKSFLSRYMLK